MRLHLAILFLDMTSKVGTQKCEDSELQKLNSMKKCHVCILPVNLTGLESPWRQMTGRLLEVALTRLAGNGEAALSVGGSVPWAEVI